MTNIIQEWVSKLSLRHQGVLLSAVRGCDFATKEDSSKKLIRVYRSVILEAFSGKKSSSFIEYVSVEETKERMKYFLNSFDHYPMHFLLHFIYAAEIVGYKHPEKEIRKLWNWFYTTLIHLIHLNPETEEQLDKRLIADEKEFIKNSRRHMI